jgi:hypothetical protein
MAPGGMAGVQQPGMMGSMESCAFLLRRLLRIPSRYPPHGPILTCYCYCTDGRPRKQSGFFNSMGLNDYYDDPSRLSHRPKEVRRQELDTDSDSSTDDEQEGDGIFDSVMGKGT